VSPKLNTTAIIKTLTSQIDSIQGIYLFGSFALNQATTNSDIDIAILCPTQLDKSLKLNTKEILETTLNKNVDLVEIRFINTIFQEEIIITAKRIATIDKMACELFEDYVYCSAMDFREFIKPHMKDIINKGTVYGRGHTK